VVCRQLGYKVGRLLELSIVNPGSNQIWLDNVGCSGNESLIENCSHNDQGNWQWSVDGACSHSKDIGVGCDASDGSSQGNAYPGIRLKNNSNQITNT